MERLLPMNDFAFKKLFGEQRDKDLLQNFLEAVLSEKIVDVIIKEEKKSRETIADKQSILDIKAKIQTEKQTEKINVEVQLLNRYNMIPRTLFYWSKLYSSDLQVKGDYSELNKTTTINLLNFKMKELSDSTFHSIYHLKEDHDHTQLTDLLETHFIVMPTFRKAKIDKRNPLHQWLMFLDERTDSDSILFQEVCKMNPSIRKAQDKFTLLSESPEFREAYEQRFKAQVDYNSQINGARKEGMEEGMKKGIKTGIKEGKKEEKKRDSSKTVRRRIKFENHC
ncbi:Rpn family recombination-promoting nuclease/putative transposase [Terrilactibacillus sp. S3-3]|nr:Rpn family recombination-promoting nuclease/putative transposase [Terrilactibacillus sp. S3-3]